MEHPSNSKVQREIEHKIVKRISKRERFSYVKKTCLKTIDFEFDFYSAERKIIGEVYAGIEPINPGSVKKIIADCLKLVFAEKLLGSKYSKRIVFVDNSVKSKFEGKSWAAKAIEQFRIKLSLEPLLKSDRLRLEQARKRQARSNVKNRI